MNIERLTALVERAINAEQHELLQWEEDGVSLRVQRLCYAVDAGAEIVTPAPSAALILTSTMHGLLYLFPEPGAPAFVAIGDVVDVGQQVGLIEAMKTFCPVLAGHAGRLVAVLAEHGAEISFGQPLFQLE